MTEVLQLRPLKEAARITKVLDTVLGQDRFDHGPVDIANLALEYSKQVSPESPIHEVVERPIPGCVGALVYSESKPRQWAIMYDENQSSNRRAFTIGHEFGHYILHRQLIEKDGEFVDGIYCDENSIDRRNGIGLERDADQFAAALLMPLHDFRRNHPPKDRVDFDLLGRLATRYGVSLTAVILRWLECTETRAIVVISNEGFAHWAKSSNPALRSGLFLRTKDEVFELPAESIPCRSDFTDQSIAGIEQPANVWFSEPLIEMCIRSENFDQEITLLQFDRSSPKFQIGQDEFDSYDYLRKKEK